MLKNFSNLVITQTRNYAFKSHLKIKWIRPAKLQCYDTELSGDRETIPEIPRDRPTFLFAQCKEYETADETVKQLCSVGFNGGREVGLLARKELLSRVMRHKYDTRSMEAKIATITGYIRGLQSHLEKMPLDKQSKAICKELIDKRKKWLKVLRRWDYKKFEWLLEKLSLVYKPPPTVWEHVTRKNSLTKLTDMQCEEIKAKKMAEYKEILMKQREELLKEFGIDPKDREFFVPEDYNEMLENEYQEATTYLDPEKLRILKRIMKNS